jgi:hypothetical protein
MRVGDTVKAVGLAALILALNLLATVAAVGGVGFAAGLGANPLRFDESVWGAVAAWSLPIAGGLLFLAVIASLGRRLLNRNAWTFAVRTWIAYVILASWLALTLLVVIHFWWMAMWMALALAGALAGAALARPRPSQIGATP